MPVKDSIQVLSDSARLAMDSVLYHDSVSHAYYVAHAKFNAHADSIALADSIARADSIANVDSIALHAFKGFDGVVVTGVPSDQNWVFLLLLFMFGIVVIAFLRAISSPISKFTSYFKSKSRTSIFDKTSIDSFEQKVYFFIFSITSISLFSYLVFYDQTQPFNILTYLYFLVAIVLFFLVKYILSTFLSYIFLDKASIKVLTDSYLNVVTLMAFLFYLFVLMHLYTIHFSNEFIMNVAIIITVFGLILFIVKLVQIFLHKIVVSLYLLLYLCTLEILPVIGLIQVFKYLAK